MRLTKSFAADYKQKARDRRSRKDRTRDREERSFDFVSVCETSSTVNNSKVEECLPVVVMRVEYRENTLSRILRVDNKSRGQFKKMSCRLPSVWNDVLPRRVLRYGICYSNKRLSAVIIFGG